MTVIARLAMPEDADAIVAIARQNAEETKELDRFSERRVREVIDEYLKEGDPVIYVSESRRRVTGVLVAGTGRLDYRDGFFVSQRVLCVLPEYRGTRAAVLLVKALIEWAKRLGATDVFGGNDSNLDSERTARFFERFGFDRVGYCMRMRLGDGQRDGVD
jgi:GNAT superfamily N-acetyltransferase